MQYSSPSSTFRTCHFSAQNLSNALYYHWSLSPGPDTGFQGHTQSRPLAAFLTSPGTPAHSALTTRRVLFWNTHGTLPHRIWAQAWKTPLIFCFACSFPSFLSLLICHRSINALAERPRSNGNSSNPALLSFLAFLSASQGYCLVRNEITYSAIC